MPALQLTCPTFGGSGSGGCYHGTCNNVTGVCECDVKNGWTDDVAFFWVNDCNMPTYWMSMMGGVTIALAVMVLAIGTYHATRTRVKGTMRKALLWILITQVGMMTCGIAIIVQQASTPVFWLLMGFSMAALPTAGAVVVKEFLDMAMLAAFRGRKNVVKLNWMWPLFPILGGGPFLCCAFIGFAIQQDPVSYNTLIISTLLSTPLLQIITTPVLWSSTTKLIIIMESHLASNTTTRSDIATRKLTTTLENLKAFRKAATANACSFVVCVIPLGITFFVLGHRIPYMYIITFILVSSVSLTCMNFFVFLHKTPKESSSSVRDDAQIVVSMTSQGDGKGKDGMNQPTSSVLSDVVA